MALVLNLDATRDETGVTAETRHEDGATTANRVLMQFTADLIGSRLQVSTMSDCSPLGATLAGLPGMGVYRSLEEIVYRPFAEPGPIAAIRMGWHRAVR